MKTVPSKQRTNNALPHLPTLSMRVTMKRRTGRKKKKKLKHQPNTQQMETSLLHLMLKLPVGQCLRPAGFLIPPLHLALRHGLDSPAQQTVLQSVKLRSFHFLPNPEEGHSLLQVAPINPKTHLGSRWFSQNPRRRKHQPLPLPLLDWQHLQTQALCPLSKGRAPDPARPLSPPTRSRMKTTTKITREMGKKGVREEHLHLRLCLVTHGTASLRQQTQWVQTLPLINEAHPALSVLQAPRARNGLHLVLLGHPPVTKFSLILSPPLAPPLQLSV